MLFQSFWTGTPLSPYERLCIKSFLDHGHEYRLYSYDQPDNLPAGCELRDAGEILPRAILSQQPRPSFAMIADLFRYRLLFRHGGWWVDTDILCLTPDWPDAARQIGREDIHPAQQESIRERINNAVIRAEPGDPLMREAFAIASDQPADWTHGASGPALVSWLVANKPNDYAIQPPQAFYPVAWYDTATLLAPDAGRLAAMANKGSYCLHLWNDVLARLKVGKHITPPAGSLLHAAFAQHDMLGAFDGAVA